jgi:hypothetical protein
MSMEQLVEWEFAEETEIMWGNLPQYFVHYKFPWLNLDRTRAAVVGRRRLTAWATVRELRTYIKWSLFICVRRLVRQCGHLSIILRCFQYLRCIMSNGEMIEEWWLVRILEGIGLGLNKVLPQWSPWDSERLGYDRRTQGLFTRWWCVQGQRTSWSLPTPLKNR